MPEQYRAGFLNYVKESSTSPLMQDIAKQWRSSVGACFLVAQDRDTGEVVGCLGLQPVQMMGDCYSWWVDDVVAHHKLTSSEGLESFVRSFSPEQTQKFWGDQFEEQRDHEDNTLYSAARTIGVKDIISQQLIDEVCDEYELDRDAGVKLFNEPTIEADNMTSFSPVSTSSTASSVDTPWQTPNFCVSAESLQDDGSQPLDFSRAKKMFPSHKQYRECEYRRVCVSDSCRGTGLAQLLITASLELSARVFGYQASHLTTSNVMLAAMYFYRKCAFREVYFSYVFDSGMYWPETHFRWCFTPLGAVANPLRDTVSHPILK